METSTQRIKDMAGADRPRERLAALGPEALRNAELVAIVLRTGVKGASAVQVAETLLARYGSLGELARATVDDLRATKGIGRDKAIALKSALTLARRMVQEVHAAPQLMDTPDRVADLLREENRHYAVEQFQVVLLNTRRRLIRVERIAQGTLDTVLVHPREVFKCAISANASSLILVHNHPSGDSSSSEADIRVTRDLIRAGQLLKIEVVDHVILGKKTIGGDRDYTSLRELGYFYT